MFKRTTGLINMLRGTLGVYTDLEDLCSDELLELRTELDECSADNSWS